MTLNECSFRQSDLQSLPQVHVSVRYALNFIESQLPKLHKLEKPPHREPSHVFATQRRTIFIPYP